MRLLLNEYYINRLLEKRPTGANPRWFHMQMIDGLRPSHFMKVRGSFDGSEYCPKPTPFGDYLPHGHQDNDESLNYHQLPSITHIGAGIFLPTKLGDFLGQCE